MPFNQIADKFESRMQSDGWNTSRLSADVVVVERPGLSPAALDEEAQDIVDAADELGGDCDVSDTRVKAEF